MSVHRLLALLVVLALAIAVSVGGAVASADAASSGGVAAKAAKRAQAATCAKQRSAAHRARARRRATRDRSRDCRSPRALRLGVKKQVAASGPWSVPTSAAAAAAGTTPAAPAPGGPLAPAPAPDAPPPPGPVVSTLGVGAYDMDGFVLRLTRTSVPAGMLTIFFRNHDVSDHNLWISSPDGETVERISDTVGEDGGGSRTLPVTAGAWRLFCSLPDHDAMTRTLTVSP